MAESKQAQQPQPQSGAPSEQQQPPQAGPQPQGGKPEYSAADMAGYAARTYGSAALAAGAYAAAEVESVVGLEEAQAIVDDYAKREV